ncbi:MAG TPA: hypothetical protein VFW85_06965 [Gaiellaceae bacterium]|nr:hypothetical protein [Gaiellaceae bacterium]
MHIKAKLALLFLMVLALLPTATNAYACGGGGSHSSGIAFASVRHERFSLFRVAANYLGVTPWQLTHQLRQGKSLADVANATTGKSASGLVDELSAAIKTKLDAKVAAGTLSSTQEATILGNLAPKLTALVNLTWSGWWWHHDRDRG